MPVKPRKKKSEPVPTAADLVQLLLDALLGGARPTAVVNAIVAAERAATPLSAEAVQAWLASLDRRTDLDADVLLDAYFLTRELQPTAIAAEDLLPAAITAAAREKTPLPADMELFEDVDWDDVPSELRWDLLNEGVGDAAAGRPSGRAHEVLPLLLEHVLPTLLSASIDRLEWWMQAAASQVSKLDTDINLGDEAASTALAWVEDACRSDKLDELLRLVAVLRAAPQYGCIESPDACLRWAQDALRAALPEPTSRKKGPLKKRG